MDAAAVIPYTRHAVSFAGGPPRTVDVWTPPAAAEPLTVLYMHDGQNLFDPAQSYAGVTWGVAETLTRLLQAGRIPPAMVVGIHNVPNRMGEYMPARAVTRTAEARRLVQQDIDGWRAEVRKTDPDLATWTEPAFTADDYLRFIVHDLKPFIDSTYPTRPGPAHTLIIGSSMGGLISAYAFCEYPDVFGRAGCLSTAWPVGGGVAVPWLEEALPAPHGRRIYFDYGTEGLDADYEPFQQRADAALHAAGYRPGVDCLTRKFPGHPHHESAWAERLPIPLEFLLAP